MSGRASETTSKLQSFLADKKDTTNVVIEWQDINYLMRMKDQKKSKFMKPVYYQKKILNGLSGRAVSGELLAIMGPTGCGKTSLLNCLAARMPSGGAKNSKLSGRILINGVDRNDEKFRKTSAYVLQVNLLIYSLLTIVNYCYY
jgi:ABC-type multidrug transport system ATPase subunit